MAIEDLIGTDKFIDALVVTNPEGSDPKSEGDDHARGTKNVMVNSWPNIAGAVTLSHTEINALPADIHATESALVGSVAAFPLATFPAAWLRCDGGLKNIADHPALGAYLGSAYGGDGATTFAVPDMRGEFLRGRDGGAGRNPDGDLPEGTRQAEAFLSHNHIERGQNLGGGAAATVNQQGSNNPSSIQFQDTTLAAGGNETRSRNMTVNWAIYAGPPGT